jgi:hypothetical protein
VATPPLAFIRTSLRRAGAGSCFRHATHPWVTGLPHPYPIGRYHNLRAFTPPTIFDANRPAIEPLREFRQSHRVGIETTD